MHGEFLWVYGINGDLLIKVKRSPNRLYKTLLEVVKPTCLLSKQSDQTWLWHKRLGHVNFQAMKFMGDKAMAVGLPSITPPTEVCESCVISKQARAPFPSHAIFRAQKVLELVHGDICGPITPPTPAGNRYFFMLVDDYSRVMWTFMLKTLLSPRMSRVENCSSLEPIGEESSCRKNLKLTVKKQVSRDISQHRTHHSRMVS